MGAAFTKCLGSATSDPKKLEMVIGQCFGFFDKDKSGYIDAAEGRACAEKVFAMAKIKGVSPTQFDSVFGKVAGTDQKLDKAEFTQLVNQLLSKAGAAQVPVPASTAAPAAATAAPAGVPAALGSGAPAAAAPVAVQQ